MDVILWGILIYYVIKMGWYKTVPASILSGYRKGRVYTEYFSDAKDKFNQIQHYFELNSDKVNLIHMRVNDGTSMFLSSDPYVEYHYILKDKTFVVDFGFATKVKGEV